MQYIGTYNSIALTHLNEYTYKEESVNSLPFVQLEAVEDKLKVAPMTVLVVESKENFVVKED